jgi:hypothetical protein
VQAVSQDVGRLGPRESKDVPWMLISLVARLLIALLLILLCGVGLVWGVEVWEILGCGVWAYGEVGLQVWLGGGVRGRLMNFTFIEISSFLRCSWELGKVLAPVVASSLFCLCHVLSCRMLLRSTDGR